MLPTPESKKSRKRESKGRGKRKGREMKSGGKRRKEEQAGKS